MDYEMDIEWRLAKDLQAKTSQMFKRGLEGNMFPLFQVMVGLCLGHQQKI